MSWIRHWWHSRLGHRLLVEMIGIAALILSYKYVRFLARDAGEPALDNARRVLDIERSMGFDIEEGIQDLALRSQAFMRFINHYYVASHFAVTFTVIFWVYLFRAHVYTRLRWVLIGITLSALAIHVAFPLAPPRMMSGTGFIDTLRAYGPSIYGSPDEGNANQFAAMPSLHFGYAALAAWAIILSFKTRWRYLAISHPALMLFSIMATANHYWLDAAAAGALLVFTGLVVWWLVNVPDPDDPDHDDDPDGTDAEEALERSPLTIDVDATDSLIDA
ncbi:MAG: phosphatase PAP2 family protein [Acidimicrobiales bacterium]